MKTSRTVITVAVVLTVLTSVAAAAETTTQNEEGPSFRFGLTSGFIGAITEVYSVASAQAPLEVGVYNITLEFAPGLVNYNRYAERSTFLSRYGFLFGYLWDL